MSFRRLPSLIGVLGVFLSVTAAPTTDVPGDGHRQRRG